MNNNAFNYQKTGGSENTFLYRRPSRQLAADFRLELKALPIRKIEGAYDVIHAKTKEFDSELYKKLTRGGNKSSFDFPAVTVDKNKVMKHYGTKGGDVTHFYAGDQTAYYIDPISRLVEFPAKRMQSSSIYREDTTLSQKDVRRLSFSRMMKLYATKPNTAPEMTGNSREKMNLPPLRGPLTDEMRTHGTQKLGKILNNINSKAMELPDFTKLPTIPRSGSLLTSDNDTKNGVCANAKDANKETTPETSKGLHDTSTTNSSAENSAELILKCGSIQNSGPSVENVSKEQSSYELRKEYSRNLERNWLIEQLRKRGSDANDEFVFRPEMFYSPPPSDTDMKDSDTESDLESERLVKSPDLPPIENKTLKKHFGSLKNPEMFSSTDVLMGENGELDPDRRTPSEYEIVLEGGKLIEKKTKHKMRKRRRRKQTQYKQFLRKDSLYNYENIANLSEKEIRAMRLNIAKRGHETDARENVNSDMLHTHLFTSRDFKKLLETAPKKPKKKKKGGKKTKKVSWKSNKDGNNVYGECQSAPPSIKDRFMNELGTKLIRDIDALKFKPIPNSSTFSETDDTWLLKDIIADGKPHRLAERRKSDPGLERTALFPIVVKGKSKTRRRDKSKTPSSKRVASRGRSPDKAKYNYVGDRNGSATKKRERSASRHVKPAEPKVIMFDRSEILQKRRFSLDQTDFKDKKAIELHDLLRDVDIPAKDIRIQVAMRKMKRNKKKKDMRKYLEKFTAEKPPTPEPSTSRSVEDKAGVVSDHSGSDCETSMDDNCASPLVFSCGGVSWNKTGSRTQFSYKSVDVEKELQSLSRLFIEMKDCRYIRWTPFNQAIITKLNMA